VEHEPLPVLSKVQFLRPQILPAAHVLGTVVVVVAPGASSMPPESVPLKTGTTLPAPATQTVSEQLFLIVNCRVWAFAVTTAATMNRIKTADLVILSEVF
jgi:hypothetical protein